MSLVAQIGVAWIAMSAAMAALWYVQYRMQDAGIVDIAWSFGTGMCAIWFAFNASGDPVRRAIVAVLFGVWGTRLGFALFARIVGHAEDGRYRMLREKWGERTQLLMFGFFQLQAFWAVLFALPAMGAAQNASALGWMDCIGVLIWLTAIVGESLADHQLSRFRIKAENKGQVCREGLWAYSRHPNYFFEWIHWFSYIFLAFGSPFAWLTWVGSAIMLVFLTKITGIPMTEARSVISKGDAYLRFQREVSPFFPWPSKKGGSK